MSGFLTKDTVVLDVTSRAVCASVTSRKAQSVFGVKAIVEKTYDGFENGEWFDADETAARAEAVLKEAVAVSGIKPKRVFIGVPAEFLSVVSKTVSVILDKERRVSDEDIRYLLRKGDVFDKKQYCVINTSAIYFSVDTSDKNYFDVRGLPANRVEAFVSYVLAERTFTSLFDNAAAAAGFSDVRYIAVPWAECISLFEREQRETPIVLLDIGYISSSVAIGRGEGLIDLKSFSLGGGHVSADIYDALEVPFELADQARELVDLNLCYGDDAVLIGDSKYTLYAGEVAEIVKDRLDVFAEIVSDILNALPPEFPDYVTVYLTGEGITGIRGAAKYFSSVLGRKIEITAPKLPGFAKPADSSKTSLIAVAETLAGLSAAEIIKRIIKGDNYV